MKSKEKRGSGLFVVMLLIGLLALLTVVAGNSVIGHSQEALHAGTGKRAKYAARAGLESVMNELGKNEDYAGSGGHHIGTVFGSPELSYDVTITNNANGTGPIPVPGSSISVEAGAVHLQARGEEQVSGASTSVVGMIGLAFKTRPNFNHAAYAIGYLSSENGEVDAWTSSTMGSYWGPRAGAYTTPPPEEHEATLGGNADLGDSIRVLGTSQLDGHVVEGPGATAAATTVAFRAGTTTTTAAATTIAATATVAGTPPIAADPHGTKVPKYRPPYHDSAIQPGRTIGPPPPPPPPPPGGGGGGGGGPPPPPPDRRISPGAYEYLRVTPGTKLKMEPGIYYFQHDFVVDDAEIEVDNGWGSDPVVVFVGEEARFINRADVNKDGETHEFQLSFTDELVETDRTVFETEMQSLWDAATATEVTARWFPPVPPPLFEVEYSTLIVDDTEFVGAISGRGLEAVVRNGSELYGAIMAADIRLTDSKIHQDLSLKGARVMSGSDWNLSGVHEVKL